MKDSPFFLDPAVLDALAGELPGRYTDDDMDTVRVTPVIDGVPTPIELPAELFMDGD